MEKPTIVPKVKHTIESISHSDKVCGKQDKTTNIIAAQTIGKPIMEMSNRLFLWYLSLYDCMGCRFASKLQAIGGKSNTYKSVF
ncbi:hypothetical protein DHW03_09540 [Pedobacter yonginense]|uniref:Uncharacterized protein n=1 Tax=Pedobacter yonginense TaxID=651869 RepID=A0A317EPA4_9SPHI|nr:hypothetical protein DHW03_09540 [Pedobacter yonginense]